MIPEIQNKQNIAKWKKEYSVINNAFNEVLADGVTICNHTQDGNCNGQGYTDEFFNAMKSKFNVIDFCGLSTNYKCDNDGNKNRKYKWVGIGGSPSRYKALSGGSNSKVNSYNFQQLALLLSDGAVIYFGDL